MSSPAYESPPSQNSLKSIKSPQTDLSSSTTVSFRSSLSPDSRRSSSGLKNDAHKWGHSGYLTPKETTALGKLRLHVSSLPQSYQSTVFTFKDAGEGEDDCLLRWLRARRFKVKDVQEMIESAHSLRQVKPPPPQTPAAIVQKLNPQYYLGHTKSGNPIFISKPGKTDVYGLECCLNMEGVMGNHWEAMEEGFTQELLKSKNKHSAFDDYSCLCVLDLHGLNSSQLNKKMLRVVKEQASIDNLCYPETMNLMILLSPPPTFAIFYRLIRAFLPSRTVSKIELYANRSKGLKRLSELIDEEELSVEYGGTKEAENSDEERVIVERLRLGKGFVDLAVSQGESLTVKIYTKTQSTGVFVIKSTSSEGNEPLGTLEVTNDGNPDNDGVTDEVHIKHIEIDFGLTLKGPGTFRVEGKAGSSMFGAGHDFLIVGTITSTEELKKPSKPLVSPSSSPEIEIIKTSYGRDANLRDGTDGSKKKKRGSFFGRGGKKS
ncbi:hypothetical protein TrST_g9440 [Triparma strigata]|uniref:CRAL-TRIO domain-containing protein n=1 Tax=Triparma strigata TaxID=1606541 RepID=A0A9W7AN83_9STRA|nr:hypothetical protein TrST_g9440 [Triparma strigata]